MLMLTMDVGTTCVKAQLFDGKGNILFYRSHECPLVKVEGIKVVDIVTIIATVKELIAKASKEGQIDSIAISSLGEAFVLIDKLDNIISYPMLYTDRRGSGQAQRLADMFGKSKVFALTGTVPNAMYSISKLMWLKENRPDLLAKADKLLLVCDYIGYILTGKRVIDYSLAARTGVFDIKNKRFANEILRALDIDEKLFSHPMPTGSVVGRVKRDIAEELGLNAQCKLILGSHDQICATLGAGVISCGQSADGMGTVECITAVFGQPIEDVSFGEMGYCVTPYINDSYCTYIFNYTSNSLVNWFRKDIMHGYLGEKENQFDYLENSAAPTDVMCLPYFAGSATPYCDDNAKGAFLNLTCETRDVDIYRAVLEATSFEMKLNLETVSRFGIAVNQLVATGGGANSKLWLQIKSDILGIAANTLRSSEGGLCGLAMLSAVAMGESESLKCAREIFVRYKNSFEPQSTYGEIYKNKYEKYKKLYHILKEIN